jgi:hypothetical protein
VDGSEMGGVICTSQEGAWCREHISAVLGRQRHRRKDAQQLEQIPEEEQRKILEK